MTPYTLQIKLGYSWATEKFKYRVEMAYYVSVTSTQNLTCNMEKLRSNHKNTEKILPSNISKNESYGRPTRNKNR